jgi:hypothetical protein
MERDRALHNVRNRRRYLRLHGGGVKLLWHVRSRRSHHVMPEALRKHSEVSSQDISMWATRLTLILAMTSNGASGGAAS